MPKKKNQAFLVALAQVNIAKAEAAKPTVAKPESNGGK